MPRKEIFGQAVKRSLCRSLRESHLLANRRPGLPFCTQGGYFTLVHRHARTSEPLSLGTGRHAHLLQTGSVFAEYGHEPKTYKGIKDFRERARTDQLLLHTYLRTGTTVVFHFLEAYLNGLAFDCLLRHHDERSQADHDLLLEWDSKNARRAFVNIEQKLFRYPLIFGKYKNIGVDLSACRAAHFLASDAKELRDALTHPSPHLDRRERSLRKVTLIATINFERLETIFDAAKEYTLTVERTLFGHPEETAPWLFPRPEKPNDTQALTGRSAIQG